MCIVTLQHIGEFRNPPQAPESEELIPEATEPLPGWQSASDVRASMRRSRREDWARRAKAYVPGDDPFRTGVPGILDRPLINLPGLDRRRAARQSGLILSDRERCNVRRAISAALGCGTRWAAFRRFEATDKGTKEYRLACQLACGNRTCPDCDEKRRKRESWRVEGPWKMFLTLTLSSNLGSVGYVWRMVHRYLDRFIKRLRRASASSDTWPILHDEDRGWTVPLRMGDENNDAMVYQGLDYAWVLEPHRSGRPHIHMVLSASYIDYGWAISQWRESSKWNDAACYGERIKSKDGVSRYLCKYISKATLSSDILGLLRRRRLWASTMPNQAPKEPLWTREEDTSADQAWLSAALAAFGKKEDGWVIESQRENGYCLWSRLITESSSDQDQSSDLEKWYFIISTSIEGRTVGTLEPESLSWSERYPKETWHDY